MSEQTDLILAMNQAGYSKRRIAEVLNLPGLTVKKALAGRASMAVAREKEEPVGGSPVSPYSVVTPHGMRMAKTRIGYADELPQEHGPVRQIMKNGKPCNEIVWSPK